jgi:succinoglycan biosynthesis transport protein ExoP
MAMGNLTPYSPSLPSEPLPSPNAEGLDLARVWAAISRRWRVFAAILFSFVILVGISTKLTPKTYTTTARLIAGNPGQGANTGGSTTLPILNALVLQSGEVSAETFATLAQQEDVAAAVIRSLNLKTSPRALLGHVSVKPVTNTPILGLSVTWRNAADSAKIANAFADAFIVSERDFVRSQSMAALGFLSNEIPNAEASMRQAASDLANFESSNGIVDAGSHSQSLVTQATTIESKIQTTTLDSREASALLDNVNNQLASMPTTINNAQQISVNPILSDLESKLEDLNLQLNTARQQYTEHHPLVVSLEKRRNDVIAQIARQPTQINSQNIIAPNPVYQMLQQQSAQYRQRIDGDNAQLALLRRERAKMLPLLSQLPQQSMRLATLQQRAKLASDVYNALEQKYNDATIAKSTAISDISIVQPATADSAAVRPNVRVNLLAAIVVGLLLASIVVFILDALERPIREGSESRILGLPIMARIPAFNKSTPRMLPWVQSMTVEAFLQLCVSLKLKNKRPLRTLAITSPSRGDGKSTVAFNLAKAMAKLQPVLLIDCDLRKPTLHHLAPCSNTQGLSDVLQSTRTLSECVLTIAVNLDLLPAGCSADNPVALVQSQKFDDLLQEAESRYSMIIVDTPALSYVTEGILVSSKADGTVLIVAANSTNEQETKEVVARFATLGVQNLLGVVLNKDTKRFADYSDYFSNLRSALPGGTT